MVGMPCALAFAATAEPDSLLIEAITSTLTPLASMLSASVENFCSSPRAFWMSASRPSARIASVSSGLSKPSQRAELSVSGRITPTLTPPVGEALSCGADGAATFWPQAASTRVSPSPAAASAVLLMRMVVLPQLRGMLWATTYVPRLGGAKHTGSLKLPHFGHVSVSQAGYFFLSSLDHP